MVNRLSRSGPVQRSWKTAVAHVWWCTLVGGIGWTVLGAVLMVVSPLPRPLSVPRWCSGVVILFAVTSLVAGWMWLRSRWVRYMLGGLIFWAAVLPFAHWIHTLKRYIDGLTPPVRYDLYGLLTSIGVLACVLVFWTFRRGPLIGALTMLAIWIGSYASTGAYAYLETRRLSRMVARMDVRLPPGVDAPLSERARTCRASMIRIEQWARTHATNLRETIRRWHHVRTVFYRNGRACVFASTLPISLPVRDWTAVLQRCEQTEWAPVRTTRTGVPYIDTPVEVQFLTAIPRWLALAGLRAAVQGDVTGWVQYCQQIFRFAEIIGRQRTTIAHLSANKFRALGFECFALGTGWLPDAPLEPWIPWLTSDGTRHVRRWIAFELYYYRALGSELIRKDLTPWPPWVRGPVLYWSAYPTFGYLDTVRVQRAYLDSLAQWHRPEPIVRPGFWTWLGPYMYAPGALHILRRQYLHALALQRAAQAIWNTAHARRRSATRIGRQPLDPWTGHPIRTAHTAIGQVFYSVGENRTDDHAAIHPDWLPFRQPDVGLVLPRPLDTPCADGWKSQEKSSDMKISPRRHGKHGGQNAQPASDTDRDVAML